MFERLTAGRHLLQIRAAALREDGVAGIAVVGFNGSLAVLGLVIAIVTTETAGPDHVADVVRINAPVGLHLGEEIVPVNLLHHRDDLPDARVVGCLLYTSPSPRD